MQRTVLVAIGGNSLIRAGEPTTVATQHAHVTETCRALARIIADGVRPPSGLDPRRGTATWIQACRGVAGTAGDRRGTGDSCAC